MPAYRGFWKNGSGRLLIADNDASAVRRFERIEAKTGRKFTSIRRYDSKTTTAKVR